MKRHEMMISTESQSWMGERTVPIVPEVYVGDRIHFVLLGVFRRGDALILLLVGIGGDGYDFCLTSAYIYLIRDSGGTWADWWSLDKLARRYAWRRRSKFRLAYISRPSNLDQRSLPHLPRLGVHLHPSSLSSHPSTSKREHTY